MGPRPYGRTAFSMPQLADPTTPPPTIPIQTANVPVRGRYHRPPFAACLCLTPCYWLQLARRRLCVQLQLLCCEV